MSAGAGVEIVARDRDLGEPCLLGRDIHVPVLKAGVYSYEWDLTLERCGELVYPDYKKQLRLEAVNPKEIEGAELCWPTKLEFIIGTGNFHTVLSRGCRIPLKSADSDLPALTLYDSIYSEDVFADVAEFRPSDLFVDMYNLAWTDPEVGVYEIKTLCSSNVYDENGMDTCTANTPTGRTVLRNRKSSSSKKTTSKPIKKAKTASRKKR